jgi:hypothetical protein
MWPGGNLELFSRPMLEKADDQTDYGYKRH